MESRGVTLRELDGRAKWAIVTLVAIAILDAVAVWFDIERYDLLGRIINNGSYTLAEADASDHHEAAIGILQTAGVIVGAIAFIRWFLNAYRNVNTLGGARKHQEYWAGLSWFIPFLNLWRPKQIANEIWRASDPEHPNEHVREDAPVSSLLSWWWFFWIVSNLLSNVATRFAFNGDSAESLRNATATYLAGDAIDIVAAIFAIVVIRRITAREWERAALRTIQA